MTKSKKFGAYLLFTFLLIAFGSSVYAQDDDEPQGMYLETPRVFYGGLLVGADFCQVDGDYFAGYHKVGLNVGAIGYAQLKRHLALSMEILYTEKGSKSTIDREVSSQGSGVFITQYGITANYAEIPVMVNYFDKRKSHFGVGLSYGQLVHSNEVLVTAPAAAGEAIDLNKYPFRKSELEALAGFELHLVKGLFLNVRFQYSILPMRSDIPPTFARATQYNNLFVVRFMYLFI